MWVSITTSYIWQYWKVYKNDTEWWLDCISSYTCIHHKTSFRILSLTTITFIKNNSIKINQFPGVWKFARISPILKIQLPVELKDYRSVSILPILSEIYERFYLEQITNFIEKKLIYHHYQSGYCKNHSTEKQWKE